MNVLIWHVHGSWTTAFVQGRHRYLLPDAARARPRGAAAGPRRGTGPPSAVEVSPERAGRRRRRRRGAAAARGGRAGGALAAAGARARRARRLPRAQRPARRHGRDHAGTRWPTATTCCSCTSRTSTRLMWDAGSTPTTVVEHGIVDPGHRYTGELAGAAVVRQRAGAPRPDHRHRPAARAWPRPRRSTSSAWASTAWPSTCGCDRRPRRRRPAPAPHARRAGPPRGLRAPAAVDLARAVADRGDAPGHAGGRAGDHRGGRGRAAGRRGLLHRPGAAARRPARRWSTTAPRRRGAGAAARAAALEPLRRSTGSSPTGTPCWTGPSSDAPARRRRHVAADHVEKELTPCASPWSPNTRARSPRSAGSTPAGRTSTSSSWARALAAAGHEVTVCTRRDDPDRPSIVPLQPGVDRPRTSTAGPRAPVPKDELVPYLPAFARRARRGLARRAARRRARALLDVRAGRGVRGAAPLDLPFVQTFHALGSVKRRHQGAADTSPPGRVAAERAVARRVDRVIATCTDEVFELARLGATARRVVRGALRGRHGRVLPGRPGRAAQRAAPAGRARAARAAQGRRRGDRRAAPAAGRRAARRGRPAATGTGALDPTPTRAGCGTAAAAPGSRTGSGCSAPSPGRRCRRCCARPTPSCACPGTSRSGSCRSRPWRAGAPVVASAVGGIQDTVVRPGDRPARAAAPARRRWRQRSATLLAAPDPARSRSASRAATACWPATAGTASPTARERVYEEVLSRTGARRAGAGGR